MLRKIEGIDKYCSGEYFKVLNKLHAKLLKKIKKNLPELEAFLNRVNDHWAYEDLVYRYYHGSFKLYRVQGLSLEILKLLKKISPHKNKDNMNENFYRIMCEGGGFKFDISHNEEWGKRGRPMLEAFFHAKYFLEMAVKYGRELTEAPQCLPSGWASLLYLYNIRS